MKQTPSQSIHLARVLAFAGMVIALSPPSGLTSAALGQENTVVVQPRGGGSRGGTARTGGRSQTNRPSGGVRTGLSGVRSAAPRPMKSLGGVRAKMPRPIGNRGSLLPPAPNPPSHGGGSGVGGGNGVGGGGGSDGVGGRRVRGIPGVRTPRDILGDGRGGGRGRTGTNGVRGSFRDDDFRLRFNIGGGSFDEFRRRRHHHDHDGHDHDGHGGHGHHGNAIVWPWWYGYGYGYGYRNDYEYYPPETVTSSPVYLDPSLLGMQQQGVAAQAPATPPTHEELADWAMYEGRVDDAIGAYREHLETTPDDADAMRRLAMALLADKKIKEGVALLGMAYEKDLSLVRKPMSADLLPEGERDLHDTLLAVVPFANRMKSASGYLAVTVLMQAQGRDAVALKILEKAKGAGLDEKLAAELETELGG